MFQRNFKVSPYRASTLLGPIALSALFGIQTNAAAADLTTLFQEARLIAVQLQKDASTMESYTRSNMTWQSHAAQITQIKEHINKAGSIVSEMQDARAGAKPWHQTAVDQITPVLKELASNTTTIIERVNTAPKQLKTPEYQRYLKDNAELAADLAKMIGDTVDADNVRAKIEELQAKLGQ